MLDGIVEAVVEVLEEADIVAFPAYIGSPIGWNEGAIVSVGIRSAECTGSGFGEYIGTRTDARTDEVTELYAMRCGVEISLDVYAPKNASNGAIECTKAFDGAIKALAGLRPGLKLSSFQRGEARPDGETGMFRMSCSAKGTAYLVAERDADDTEFTDFMLKGVLRR